MTKLEIIKELDLLILASEQVYDSYTKNKMIKIKNALTALWDKEDAYYEEIKQVLNYEETMNNLNDLKIR